MVNAMKLIPIPQENPDNFWAGTSGVPCPCGGRIEWAEAAYVPGTRACRSCLTMFAVRGKQETRRLVPQAINDDGIVADAPDETADEDLYHVPENLYPGWHQKIKSD